MQIGGVMRVRLVTATPDQTAAGAIRTMLDANVGSVVVCEGPTPVGIFTEADADENSDQFGIRQSLGAS